jgi:hypothetical protein
MDPESLVRLGHEACAQLTADQFSKIKFRWSTKDLWQPGIHLEKVLSDPERPVLDQDGKPMSICTQYLRWRFRRFGQMPELIINPDRIDIWQENTDQGKVLYLYVADTPQPLKRKTADYEPELERHAPEPEPKRHAPGSAIFGTELGVNTKAQSFSVRVGGSDTLADVQKNVADVTGIPLYSMILLNQGKKTNWEEVIDSLKDLNRKTYITVLESRKVP